MPSWHKDFSLLSATVAQRNNHSSHSLNASNLQQNICQFIAASSATFLPASLPISPHALHIYLALYAYSLADSFGRFASGTFNIAMACSADKLSSFIILLRFCNNVLSSAFSHIFPRLTHINRLLSLWQFQFNIYTLI